MFTTQMVFEPTMPAQITRSLLLKANGGSVLVEALVDAETNLWITTDTRNADGGYVVSCGNATLRVTPSGGAVYNFI